MPPLAISKADLRRLVSVAADSIRAAVEAAYGAGPAELEPARAGEPGLGAEVARAA